MGSTIPSTSEEKREAKSRCQKWLDEKNKDDIEKYALKLKYIA